MKHTFIDLFCGCGGLSKGLEQAGMECLLGIDSDRYAIETFKRNHPNSQSYLGKIEDLSIERIKELTNGSEIDLVAGGPPCQGFSTAGAGRIDDPRNFLFKEFTRIVEALSPRVILFENVTGLLAKKNESLLKEIFKEFKNLGYTVDAKVLSANEYGVPQRRRRTIIIGFKNGARPLFPIPTHGIDAGVPEVTISDAFSQIKEDSVNHDLAIAHISNETIRKQIAYIPEGCWIRKKEDQDKYLPEELYFDVDWENMREKRFREARLYRLDSNKTSPTILTSKRTFYHPKEDRYLTPRECASLQSFPIDFEFIGTQGAIYKQIGNAVPVKLAEAIASSIIESLKCETTNFEKLKGLPLNKIKMNAFNYNKQGERNV